jgi:signal transduction histidine kinase
MSHELRTPLNSGYLGLKLVLEDLEGSESPHDKDVQDTVNDVSKSISAAVDILDGLMCVEKLESGILQLHKQDVPVMSFLEECVTLFNPQARASHINLRLVTKAKKERKRESDNSKGKCPSLYELP